MLWRRCLHGWGDDGGVDEATVVWGGLIDFWHWFAGALSPSFARRGEEACFYIGLDYFSEKQILE